MQDLGYYNGTIGPLADMSIPMLDRACYFGDGVYEAVATKNHIPYALDEHIERFFCSANLLRLSVPFSKEKLRDLLCSLIAKVDDGEQIAYWQLSRGVALRSHAFPTEPCTPSLMAMLQPFKLYNVANPISAITVEDTRYLHCNIKTINLLPNIMAAQHAQEANCFEAIFHRNGRVTECTRSNVHILKEGTLITAPADHFILNGIARRHLLQACASLVIPYDERPYTLDELMDADEIIITSTGSLGARVTTVDGKTVGGKAEVLLSALQNHMAARFLRATTPAAS